MTVPSRQEIEILARPKATWTSVESAYLSIKESLREEQARWVGSRIGRISQHERELQRRLLESKQRTDRIEQMKKKYSGLVAYVAYVAY